MNANRWQKVKRILENVLELEPAARRSYLVETCGDDGDLLREVEVLLDFDDPDADLLEQTAYAAVFVENSRSLVGEQIDKYKLIDELGVGGMGSVYLAERIDGAFDQRVALKLIKRGMDSEAILRRFFTERQILASLQHPNIAHLIDGGTTNEGLPFFVMEFVEGVSIMEYANRENLDLDDRLKLFCEVCSAVTFAHQSLIIHRDLKPSNILVTDGGAPKLLDFGIAKLLRSETGNAATATQNFIFTPEYASPEQVRGEKLTTATDIYSLGVILYELLTDDRPYETDSKNISEIIQAVCEKEPERPSSVVSRSLTTGRNKTSENSEPKTKDEGQRTKPQALRGDLDNIILKSLRKEPERRYLSVEQFSEDIRRYLKGLPVTASKDTWSYRSSKFVRRNRIGVVAATLILVTLLGGLAATLYQANKAQQRFNDVRQIANSFLFEFHDAIENLPGSTPARELVVKRAIEYLDILAAESGDDAAIQRELATAYEKIGKIQGNSYYSNLGDTDGAVKSYNQSLGIRRRLADVDPNNRELQHELASSHEGVGDMQYTLNDLTGGLRSYESAVAIRETISAAEPNNLEYRYALANVLGKRGDISGMEGFPNLGDTAGALDSYRRVVALFEELVKAEPENEKYKLGFATMLQLSGMLLTTTGDAKAAIGNGQKSIAIFESLIAADPTNAKYVTGLMMGLITMRFPLLEEGRSAEAIENARRVIRTVEKQAAEDPKNAQLRRSLSVSYNSLGTSFLRSGDAKGALESYRRSLAITEERLAADPSSAENRRDVSLTKQFLAEAQSAVGEYDAALANFRESILSIETELQTDDSNIQIKDDLAMCLVNIGKILVADGDLGGAADAFRRAIPLAEDVVEKSRFNVRFKSRHADSFSEAGKAFAKLAATQGGQERESTKTEACKYLERSFEIWNGMRQAGTLSTIYLERPAEVRKELANC